MDIVAENISYTYAVGTPFAKRALSDVSFRIPSASLTGIIGHTGSGKSTLIQHFNGLLRPTDGALSVGDVTVTADAKDLSDLRKHVGMVFQYPEHQLFAETVEEDIAFGPRNLHLSAAEQKRRVRDAMAHVGLDYDALADKSPFQLSGGQMRRVAIAGALAMEPEVLVLDEPTAGLDPRGKEEIFHTIVELRRTRKMTVVFVSHSMEDVARYADHMLLLSQGTVVMEGPPDAIFKRREELVALDLDIPHTLKWVERLNAFIDPPLPYALYTEEELADAIAGRWRDRKRAP